MHASLPHDIAFAFWFMLPAAVANGAPILSSKLPPLHKWNARLDFGKRFRGRPVFGAHKTWRGLVSGIIAATLVLVLQKMLVTHIGWSEFFTGGVNYASLPTFLLGPLFGIGALGGDAVESFFKRRRGRKSGQSWFPFDQLDYVIGALLVSLPFVVLTLRQYVLIAIIWFVMHLLAAYVGWKIGLKERSV